MIHVTLPDISLLSKYFLIIAIALVLLNIVLSSSLAFFRNDAMHKCERKKLFINIAIFFLMISLIALSVYAYQDDVRSVLLGTPLLAISVVFTFMFAWGIIHMKSISGCAIEVLETLVGVIEAGDQNLDGHSLHVQELSMLMYDQLPFVCRIRISPIDLQYASLLLDVGKLGVPREIINKTGKLLPHERELIQKHPEICVALFEQFPSFKKVTHWIKYHHERVDGSGYYHLKGEEIPFVSRLLAVADTYSAITMDRSYKASLPYENAISELRLVAGSQLDSELVEIFCSIPKQKIAACKKNVHERMQKYNAGNFR